MGSKVVDVGAKLGVAEKDLRALRKQRRRDVLTRIAQSSVVVISAVLGLISAQVIYPARTYVHDSYPYAPLMLASLTTPHPTRRSWIGPIILSAVLFIVTFAFMALANSAVHKDYYAPTPKYGVFSGSGEAGGTRV
jgi:hypothetical protein